MALCRRVYFPVVALAGTFLLVGSPGERQPYSAHQSGGSPLDWRLRGGAAFRAGSYREAARIYQGAYELAVRNHDNGFGHPAWQQPWAAPIRLCFSTGRRLATIYRRSGSPNCIENLYSQLPSPSILHLCISRLATSARLKRQPTRRSKRWTSSSHLVIRILWATTSSTPA